MRSAQEFMDGWFALPKRERLERGKSFSLLVPPEYAEALRRVAAAEGKTMASALVSFSLPQVAAQLEDIVEQESASRERSLGGPGAKRGGGVAR